MESGDHPPHVLTRVGVQKQVMSGRSACLEAVEEGAAIGRLRRHLWREIFQFHSSSRISEKFVEVLVLYTTLGASAVSRLDTSRLQQTKLLHKKANAY